MNTPKRIPIRMFNWSDFILQMTIIALAILTIVSFANFNNRDIVLSDAFISLLDGFRSLLLEARLKNVTFSDMMLQLLITICLGLLTTVFGAMIALFLALFAAQNLAPKWLTNVVKGITAIVRAIPTVLWVLIFAISAGLGSVAAVIGMTFHSAGYLIKAYSESFEEIEGGVIEALKASGANWWQIVFQAVLPSSITAILSWTFLRFEINFSTAIAMGAAAGAGGIGFDMFMASGFYLDLRELGAFTYTILIFAIVLELSATRLKDYLNARQSK
jgi:phosphonate transport system permease protein